MSQIFQGSFKFTEKLSEIREFLHGCVHMHTHTHAHTQSFIYYLYLVLLWYICYA